MHDNPAARLLQFLTRLRRTWDASHAHGNEQEPGILFNLDLAMGALTDPTETHLQAPVCQVVVLGPTQCGKSTVVNLLLDQEAAEASPLAAFTRATRGFTVGLNPTQQSQLEARLARLDAAGQGPGTLQAVTGVPVSGHGPWVLWDTPDFDSHASRHYRQLLPQILALADLLLLVVSKEKYSDQSVWRTVAQLEPLQLPLLVCLNKTSEPQQLSAALGRRLAQIGRDPEQVVVCPLPYREQPFASLRAAAATETLRAAVSRSLRPRDPGARLQGLRRLVQGHWAEWVAPVRAEVDAVQQWRRDIDSAVAAALAIYREQYLEHARHYDTFQRALVQLLELLEIPGIARPLARTRQVLTWPLRRALALGSRGEATAGTDREGQILEEAVAHLWLGLRHQINERCGADHAGRWWAALGGALPDRAEVMKSFLARVGQYQQDFQPEIERAAQELYEQLRQRPTTLNSLRAARVTADAAGVALAFKTGGIGVNEAVLTPAMLSLTSLLAESAVGRYVEAVKARLRGEQLRRVEGLLESELANPLRDCADRLAGDQLFGLSLSELQAAENAFAQLQ